MKLFSFGKEKEKLTLIFDIQSSVVRGALIQGMRSGTPNILHSCIIHVPYRPNSGSSYLIKRTLRAMSDVLDDAYRYIHKLDKKIFSKSLDEIHVVLSSPWITSQARIVSIEKDKEIKVYEENIQEIIDQQRKSIVDDTTSFTVIEEKVFDVRLNGYSITDWEEKTAKFLEISYTSSYANKNIVEKIQSICEHQVPKSRIHFHSSLLLQYLGMQNIYENTQNYVIVYLHGELTDTVVVKHGFPVFFGSYPFGVQTLIRKIAKNTKVDTGTAESMLSLLIGNHTDTANFESTKNIIEDITNGWKDDLKKMIDATISKDGAGYDMIVSSRTHEDYFLQCVRGTYERARVQSLSSSMISAKVPFSSEAEHIRLLALYASALSDIKTIAHQ